MNKYEKAEDLVGWKSEDGKLEVIGITKKNRRTLLRVYCIKCSNDPELFKYSLFTMRPDMFMQGSKPCGCSGKFKWEDWQYLIRARRIGEKKGFIVHGFAEDFKGAKTKLNLECSKDGYKWDVSITSIISNCVGCPKCAGNIKQTNSEIEQSIIELCNVKGYTFCNIKVFNGAHTTFIYYCPYHGEQLGNYNNFKHQKSGCRGCGRKQASDKTRLNCADVINKVKDVCAAKGYNFMGFPTGYLNAKSKFRYVCSVHGEQQTTYDSFINQGTGCPKCFGKTKLREQDALQNCVDICKKEGYEPLGFQNGYENSYSRFEYVCPKHGKQDVAYVNFVSSNTRCRECSIEKAGLKRRKSLSPKIKKVTEMCGDRGYVFVKLHRSYRSKLKVEYVCPMHGVKQATYYNFISSSNCCRDCYREKQKKLGNLYGYYPERKNEQDFLYVLNFDGKFIKVGRSFDVKRRIAELKRESKIKNIKKLYVLTGTHQEIYDLEQELHNELRERGFGYSVDWSTECFDNDSLGILNKLLDSCGLERVK